MIAELVGGGRLVNAGGGSAAQVVGGLKTGLPCMQVHGAELADGRRLHKEVERLTLVYEGATMGSHIDQRSHRQFPCSAVELLEVVGDSSDVLDAAFGSLDRCDHVVGPEASGLQVTNQITVDLDELAGQSLAFEQVGYLGLDALVTARDRSDRCGRSNGDH